ncbi:hypothetical protein ACFSKS_01380 [Pseudocitrobacter faecalis]
MRDSWFVRFFLTPTLSLREREKTVSVCPLSLKERGNRVGLSPLPEGEGKPVSVCPFSLKERRKPVSVCPLSLRERVRVRVVYHFCIDSR